MMMVQFLVFILIQFFKIDIFSVFQNVNGHSLYHSLGYLFFFCVYNVMLIFVAGIYFAVKKGTLKIGIFSLISVACYLFLLYWNRNDF